MADYEHDGCIGCKHEHISATLLPCRACKCAIDFGNKYKDKVADMYESEEANDIQKQSKLPDKINRSEFERQIESLSIKSFIQQFKYLACKINEILTYLEVDNER